MAPRRPDETLGFELPDQRALGPGPVYQGTAKQIRRMILDGTVDRDADAGAIAAARSCARSVDHAAGHNPKGSRAAGMQQAALHAQLLAWLDRLGGLDTDGDGFAQLLQEMASEGHTAPRPHPAL